MLRSYLGMFVVFMLLNLPAAKAQDCILTDCVAAIAITESCNTTSGLEKAKCFCSHSDFGSAVQTCYACVKTLGNQTLTNMFGEALNLCVSGRNTVSTGTSTNIETLTIIGVTPPPVIATTGPPSGSVLTTTISKNESSRLGGASFWLYCVVYDMAAVGLYLWGGCE